MRRLTTEDFIARARGVHGDKYDYSKSVYINVRTPVLIICPKHGEFQQRGMAHLLGFGCKKCAVEYSHSLTTKSQSEFIRSAKAVHGDRYDYSRTRYVNSKTKVCIICPEHGEFWQSPKSHIHLKAGCPKCHHFCKNTLHHGVGINDVQYATNETSAFNTWRTMLERCYDEDNRSKYPAYADVKVCDEWLRYSNFKRWYDENHKDGYDMDKDLLSGDCKIYSPDTCCFIPESLNAIVASISPNNKGYTEKGGYFYASLYMDGKRKHLGSFKTRVEAHSAYVLAKKEYVLRVAESHLSKGEIDDRIFAALLKYVQRIL